MEKYLIAGLGNIGEAYTSTRHNIGFEVVDAFAAAHNASFRTERLAMVTQVKLKGRTIYCIKPTTFMNLSGKAVSYWLQKEKVDVHNSLTILDDLALPLNKVRIRAGGSDAGHNGLKDIQLALQTTEYPRLRFGIGNQFPKGSQVDFVLGKWDAGEQIIVKKKIEACIGLIEKFVLEGITPAMNAANHLSFDSP